MSLSGWKNINLFKTPYYRSALLGLLLLSVALSQSLFKLQLEAVLHDENGFLFVLTSGSSSRSDNDFQFRDMGFKAIV